MVALSLLLAAALAAPPFHATLVASQPAANAVLSASPDRLWLAFSEPIEARLGGLVLVGPDSVEHRLAVSGDPRDVHAIIAPLTSVAPLAQGRYVVNWRIVSADGHPVSGSFAFTVGSGETAATMPPRPPASSDSGAPHKAGISVPVLAAGLRGLALASLMAFAGLLVLGGWVLPTAGDAVSRSTGFLAVAAFVFPAMHLAAWLLDVGSVQDPMSGGILTVLTESGAGQREMLRVGCALLAMWALLLARRQGVAAVFAVAALLISGAIGHSAALDPALAIPAKAVHLLAGAVWLGGLLWIALGGPDNPRYLSGVRRISTLAAAALVFVSLSGVAQLWLFLPSAAALLRSPYGRLSMAKIAGLLVLLGFGAYHRYALVPRLEQSSVPSTRLRTSVRGEIAVMLLVILLGGLLAYVPPAGS